MVYFSYAKNKHQKFRTRGNKARWGDKVDQKQMTREEKIDTLQIFAGLTEEQKNLFALGAVIGEFKAKHREEDQEKNKTA